MLLAARQGRRRGEAGVAAIEFALVFPVLLLIFFGTINIAQYAVEVRRINAASYLVADLVSRSQSTISKATVDDYFTAAELLFRPSDRSWVQANVGIDVYVYAKSTTAAAARWSRFYQGSSRCTPPVANISSTNKIGQGLADTDVIVVVACTNFTAPAASYPGFGYLSNKKIESSYVGRPRQSATLDLS